MMKKGIALILGAAMVLSMAGISASAEEQTTIKLAIWDYDADDSIYPIIVEKFEEANPDIKVEVISCAEADYEAKLTTMLAGGEDLDVFFAKSNTVLPGLQAKGYCRTISDLIEANDYDMTPYGTVIDQQCTFDGEVYGLPLRTNDWVVFYNKNIFDEAGVDYPTNDMTWEEFGELAKQVTFDNYYGAAFFPRTSFITPMMVGVEDGFDITTSDLSAFVKPAQFLVDLMEEGTMEKYAESVSMSKDQTYFFKGEWAMMYDGTWLVQNLMAADDLGFEWGVVKSPYWEGTTKNGFVTSTPACLHSDTTHPDEAFRFLTFMCGEEGGKIVAQNNLVPGYMNDEIMNVYSESTNLDETSLEALRDNVTYSLGAPTAVCAQVSSMLNSELELVLTENETAEEMVANMEAQREEILSENAE